MTRIHPGMSASHAARPPRLLVCTDTYPPQVNGVSVVTALSVSGLQARGWECAVIAPRYPANMLNPFAHERLGAGGTDWWTTVPSVPLPAYPDIRLAAPFYPRVARVVSRFRPDLVHCATEFMIGRLGQLAARRAGVPLVSSYHTDFSRYTDAYGVAWARPAVHGYLRRFHSRSARIYTPSAPARDDLRALGMREVEVWGRGVDIESFHPSQADARLRAELGLGDAFVFVHVGRLAHEKSVDCIVAAFAQLAARRNDRTYRLVIAGTGPCEPALRAQAPAGVVFLGHLDRRTALPRLYASADAFVFSSITETLGLVVLEAMASGLPVIATPAGGVADHLRDGENGIAFPALDAATMSRAMERMADDATLRARLAAGARATAEQMCWEAELDRLDASYREVVASRAAVTGAAARARGWPPAQRPDALHG